MRKPTKKNPNFKIELTSMTNAAIADVKEVYKNQGYNQCYDEREEWLNGIFERLITSQRTVTEQEKGMLSSLKNMKRILIDVKPLHIPKGQNF